MLIILDGRALDMAQCVARAPEELDQPRQRILPVARLGAMALRIDHQHALAGQAAAGEPFETPPDLVGQVRTCDIEA